MIGFSSLYCIFKIICIYYILFYKEKNNEIRKIHLFLVKMPLYTCFAIPLATKGLLVLKTISTFWIRVGMTAGYIYIKFWRNLSEIFFFSLSDGFLWLQTQKINTFLGLNPPHFFECTPKGNSAYETRVMLR